ncbi:general RNA polymerase II transcription factor [Boothiomyces sp. JEL0866]|nr:general RNA polymerase II transcription factor [Boothiomyces sp. JEL0866]
MNFHPRDSNIIVLDPGSFKTYLGTPDYTQLPKFSALSNIKNEPVFPDGLPKGSILEFLITLFLKNGVNFRQNESPVLLNVPIKWSRDEIENVVKLMFEELNVPALFLLDQPLASLYGIGVVTGVVIDIGHTSTDITPVIDNIILHACQKSIPIGGKDIDDVLKRQYKKPQSFITELKERSCVVMTKDPIQPVTLTVQNESVTIGDLRYKCCEVLFYPYLIGKNCMGIHEALKLVINSTSEPSRRVALWESIVLCGGTSNLQGLKERFEYETSKLIASSETSNEYQPKEIKWLKIPEYMTMYKERPADVTFLGGAIVSKLIFGSGGRDYISRQDYNEHGPAVARFK